MNTKQMLKTKQAMNTRQMLKTTGDEYKTDADKTKTDPEDKHGESNNCLYWLRGPYPCRVGHDQCIEHGLEAG